MIEIFISLGSLGFPVTNLCSVPDVAFEKAGTAYLGAKLVLSPTFTGNPEEPRISREGWQWRKFLPQICSISVYQTPHLAQNISLSREIPENLFSYLRRIYTNGKSDSSLKTDKSISPKRKHRSWWTCLSMQLSSCLLSHIPCGNIRRSQFN